MAAYTFFWKLWSCPYPQHVFCLSRNWKKSLFLSLKYCTFSESMSFSTELKPAGKSRNELKTWGFREPISFPLRFASLSENCSLLKQIMSSNRYPSIFSRQMQDIVPYLLFSVFLSFTFVPQPRSYVYSTSFQPKCERFSSQGTRQTELHQHSFKQFSPQRFVL